MKKQLSYFNNGIKPRESDLVSTLLFNLNNCHDKFSNDLDYQVKLNHMAISSFLLNQLELPLQFQALHYQNPATAYTLTFSGLPGASNKTETIKICMSKHYHRMSAEDVEKKIKEVLRCITKKEDFGENLISTGDILAKVLLYGFTNEKQNINFPLLLNLKAHYH